MDTLPYAPLFGTLALALLWSALFTAVEAARLQLNGTLRAGEDGHPVLPAQALVLCASLGKLLVLGLACLVGQRQSGEHGFWLAGLATTLTLLVFAEYLPRRLARRNPQAFVSLGASLLKVPLALLQPLACLLDGAAKLILRPFRAQPTAVALHTQEADDFDEDEQHEAPRQGLLDGLQSLDKITVNDILVPRNEVDGINLDEPIERIVEQLIVSRHTRLPVYHNDINQVEAILNTKLISHLLLKQIVRPHQLAPVLRTEMAVGHCPDLRTVHISLNKPSALFRIKKSFEDRMDQIADISPGDLTGHLVPLADAEQILVIEPERTAEIGIERRRTIFESLQCLCYLSGLADLFRQLVIELHVILHRPDIIPVRLLLLLLLLLPEQPLHKA